MNAAITLDDHAFLNAEDVPVDNRVVVVRVDLNVPAPTVRDVGLDADVADDWRLNVAVPCLQDLVRRRARVVLLTHRGRPQGVPVPALSTRPLAPLLAARLGCPVTHVDDCVGPMVRHAVSQLPPGGVLLLENVRFHAGEMRNDPAFVRELLMLGDIYVNEAFASLHRPHASLAGLAATAPTAAVGPRLRTELRWLSDLQTPNQPLTVLLGGVQIGLKLDLIRSLLSPTTTLMIGGGVAHTLLAARELPTGLIHYEPALMDDVRDLLTEAGVRGCRLLLPQDLLVCHRANPAAATGTKLPGRLGEDDMAMDIGPATLDTWQRLVREVPGSFLWLGSLGAWEYPAYRASTATLAQAAAALGDRAVVGGDGLLQALRLLGQRENLLRLSSGAGVLMHALRGLPLMALQALQNRSDHGERRRA